MVWWLFGNKASASTSQTNPSSNNVPSLWDTINRPYSLYRKCDSDEKDDNIVICKEKIHDGVNYSEIEYRIPLRFYNMYDLGNYEYAIKNLIGRRIPLAQRRPKKTSSTLPKKVSYTYSLRNFQAMRLQQQQQFMFLINTYFPKKMQNNLAKTFDLSDLQNYIFTNTAYVLTCTLIKASILSISTYKSFRLYLNITKMDWWPFGKKTRDQDSTIPNFDNMPFYNPYLNDRPTVFGYNCASDKDDMNFLICKVQIKDGDKIYEKVYRKSAKELYVPQAKYDSPAANKFDDYVKNMRDQFFKLRKDPKYTYKFSYSFSAHPRDQQIPTTPQQSL